MFRGLFIGIDRYKSSRVNWLTCARRDATALHALFSDTLGPSAILLVDAQATKEAIETELRELANSDADDVVVIVFSGHGSTTHELVTYDADVADLDSTSISLASLTAQVARIPAKRLICILDCCFSGAAGAKVLTNEIIPRSIDSAATLLDQLSGDGRIVFTASLATEEAFENQKLGHGLLTFHLIEALQGIEEVRVSGKISILRLLEHVTQKVIDAANLIGKQQHPTIRGTIDGAYTWPVFTPGDAYATAFPERLRVHVGSIADLAAYGFSEELLQAWATSIPDLNQLQLAAINEFGILEEKHVLVSAPTSSGKTMIGELAALKGLNDRRRAFFLLPLKALVHDKHQEFVRRYGAFGLRTIRATGDTSDDIPSLLRGQYDICLTTYEKFSALALGSPHIVQQAGTIVVDEVQMIADSSRGLNLEFILTLLRLSRNTGIEPQVIALSAVIGDTNGFERWLGGRLLRRSERPVPLDEGILLGNGSFRYVTSDSNEEHTVPTFITPEYRKGSSQDWIIPLVRHLVDEGKQVIVFRETKGDARGCARYLALNLGLPSADEVIASLPTGDPSTASANLREALRGGVAFHISDLDREERLAVEGAFRTPDTKLRVIAATTTLAMGVNTPAEAVVVAGLTHPGDEPYSVAEYKNIVGRAGRLGFTSRGASFLIAPTPSDAHLGWTRYVLGKPEDIRSRFPVGDDDGRSIILRILASNKLFIRGLSEHQIVDFLEGSFGAFLKTESSPNWAWNRTRIAAELRSLVEHHMVEVDPDGYCALTALGRLAGEAGVEVESLIRVIDSLAQLSPNEISDPTLIAATQMTVELDGVFFPLNRRSTQKEPHAWPYELSRQGVAPSVIRALHKGVTDQHQATSRAKKAVACLLWVSGMPVNEAEKILTRFGGAFDGAAGPMRGVASRTCDLLTVVCRVAEILHPDLHLNDRGARLLTRLELGIPGDVAPLGALLGSQLSRGDYLHFVQQGLTDLDAIGDTGDEVLLDCVSGDQTKLGFIRLALEARGTDSSGLDLQFPEYNRRKRQDGSVSSYDRACQAPLRVDLPQ